VEVALDVYLTGELFQAIDKHFYPLKKVDSLRVHFFFCLFILAYFRRVVWWIWCLATAAS
jgi:hypothetical protein